MAADRDTSLTWNSAPCFETSTAGRTRRLPPGAGPEQDALWDNPVGGAGGGDVGGKLGAGSSGCWNTSLSFRFSATIAGPAPWVRGTR